MDERRSRTHDRVPRWVIVVGVVALVLALAVVVLLLNGHGPAQHRGAGATADLGADRSALHARAS